MEVQSMAHAKILDVQPPTFKAKSRISRTKKKLFSAYLELQA
jgi:hypothetical protein